MRAGPRAGPIRGEAPKPLLVVLHSWSADFKQNLDIPFAEFAIANGWAMIHPDFRGGNRRPQATASATANQDVIDAVSFARRRTAIDDARIYLVGERTEAALPAGLPLTFGSLPDREPVRPRYGRCSPRARAILEDIAEIGGLVPRSTDSPAAR